MAWAGEGSGEGDREEVVGSDVARPVGEEGVISCWSVLRKERGEWRRGVREGMASGPEVGCWSPSLLPAERIVGERLD